MPSPEIRAAVYARVSTDDQATHGTSLAGQIDTGTAYVRAQGWTLAGTWVDDGVSGATLDRPALAKLRAAIARREIDRVIIAAPDRLSRDLVDGLVLEREWGQAGVTVVYLTAPEMSELERQLRGVIAQEERRAIRDRTREGRRRTVLAGGWIGGDPPFGLRVDGAGRGNRRLVIDEREASVVRMACRLLIDERVTTGQAAQSLNDTPGMGPRKAAQWDHRRLRRLLLGASWLSGTWTFDEPGAAPIPVDVPAVLTVERHHALNAVLERSSTGPRLDVGNYILRAGMLMSECGHPMYGKVRSGRVRNGDADAYVCVQQLHHGAKACGCHTLRCDTVDAAVWTQVAGMLSDPARLADMAGVALDDRRSAEDSVGADDLAALDRRIARLTTALGDRVGELLAAGMDAAVVGRATTKLQNDLDQLRRQRARVAGWATTRRERRDRASEIRRLALRSAQTLEAPTLATQVRVLTVLGVTVTVTGFQACTTCAGKGSIVAPGTGRRPPLPCPDCRRFRGAPILAIAGQIPADSSLGRIGVGDRFHLVD